MRKFIHKFDKILDRAKMQIKEGKEGEEKKGGLLSDRESQKIQSDSRQYKRITTYILLDRLFVSESDRDEDFPNSKDDGGKVTESSSYYTFYKILSSESYTLGRVILFLFYC